MKFDELRDLKPGDKVIARVAEIDKRNNYWTVKLDGAGIDGWIENKAVIAVCNEPAKIKMTEAEKKEFDKLKERYSAANLNDLLDVIWEYSKIYPALRKRFFENANLIVDRKNQFEFARALENTDLIEVEKEKTYRIKLADGYLVNVMGDWLTLKNKKDGDIFTQFEIDRLQERFKAIDLNKCKEEVEDE